jgi:hypothetical protein
MESREITDAIQYYCRGCGKPLLSGQRSLFHPECLKRDKRARTQQKRQREREKFEEWLARRKCHARGAYSATDKQCPTVCRDGQ